MIDCRTSIPAGAILPPAQSTTMKNLTAIIEQLAPSNLSVLIVGESGTGKEWTARTIHRLSPRASHKFLPIECTTASADNLAKRIFGFEKITPTGIEIRRGGLEMAEGGTIYLVDIGHLPLPLQKQIARISGSTHFRRVGGQASTLCDVRIIASLRRKLRGSEEVGSFPWGIHHRISPIIINLPPLREHREDIPHLIEKFLRQSGDPLSNSAMAISPEAIGLCLSYDWPGNIRQLQNALKYAAAICHDHLIQAEHLQLFIDNSRLDGTSEEYPTSRISLLDSSQRVDRAPTPGQSQNK